MDSQESDVRNKTAFKVKETRRKTQMLLSHSVNFMDFANNSRTEPSLNSAEDHGEKKVLPPAEIVTLPQDDVEI